MKVAASPAMTEVEPTTMVVQGLSDGVGMEEVILQPEEKRMKAAREEVSMAEAVVHEEEIPSEGQTRAPHYLNLIAEMDITEPLSILKQMLEGYLQCSLADHQFCYQDCSLLDVDKSLVEQCVKGEGIVQINLEIKSQPCTQPKINILTIWKTEDPVQQVALQEQGQLQPYYVDGVVDGDTEDEVWPVETAGIECESPDAAVDIMEVAASPAVTEVEPTTMVVQGLIDGVGVEKVILQPEEKTMKAAREEVSMDEAVVHEEEIPSEGQTRAPHYLNLIAEMDITEPLSTLKQMLEGYLQCSLADHQFCYQDSSLLDVDKTLVEQCVKGEGTVQINLEFKSQPGTQPKINILTIWKTEDSVQQVTLQEQGQLQPYYVDGAAEGDTDDKVLPMETAGIECESPDAVVEAHVHMMQACLPTANENIVAPEETGHVPKWFVHQNFRRDQERLKIPSDPLQWTKAHVQHWIQWAVKEFGLLGVDENNFQLDGQQLCNLTYPEFVSFIPRDPDDVFWTHVQIIKKGKVVAVNQDPRPQPTTVGNGNNGQIQLWQFLLELLDDKEKVNIISWVEGDGEFKLNDPEEVSRLWGQRKNKPNMNYDKMSRALRYYYDNGIIEKVRSKQFVYKFVCDPEVLTRRETSTT